MELMEIEGFHHIPVIQGGKIIGIITRDSIVSYLLFFGPFEEYIACQPPDPLAFSGRATT